MIYNLIENIDENIKTIDQNINDEEEEEKKAKEIINKEFNYILDDENINIENNNNNNNDETNHNKINYNINNDNIENLDNKKKMKIK